MLELLHHKRNLVITTVVNGSIFKKKFKAITREKNVRRRYYFSLRGTIMKL